jgi:anti-sigma factor RsiW
VRRHLLIDPHDVSCQELVELLTEYLDGTLSAHDRARLDAHLTVCDACREYLGQFRTTMELLRAASYFTPSG